MSNELAQATWPSIAEAPLVLVPLGSTEQHGPHLPFGTDTMIASAVAAQVAASLVEEGLDVILAPALPYGASGEHQEFPGTVSIGTEVLTRVIIELVRSLSTWSGRIVLVNGHGGNLAALTAAMPQLINEGHRVAWVPCAAVGADAHAGLTETSLLRYLAPGQVDLAAAEPGATAPMSTLIDRLAADGVRAVSANGILGDPTGATAALGVSLMNEMTDGVRRRILADSIDARGCLRDPVPAALRSPAPAAAAAASASASAETS
jgi:mycofactocin system creatininase family protein